MKKIGIYTFHGLSTAYSCILYLKKELELKYDVELWNFTEPENIKTEHSHTFMSTWYGNIRFFRIYLCHLHVFFMMLFSNKETYIINDLDFFIPAYYVKKIRKNKKIVHYNTEIHGEDVKYPKFIVNFYEKHADFPNMIIECLKERAIYRKQTFNIKKDIYVINNTLPFQLMQTYLTDSNVQSKYLDFKKELPILIYAGGCDLSRKLGDVIDCIPKFHDKLNFVFFCYGTEINFKLVEEQCNKYSKNENWRLYKAISKDELLPVMHQCDIGISYYDPKISVNHLYASPSKIFEYIAVGLNILSSDNVGMNTIINDNNLGYCIKENESIEDGINKLLEKGLQSKEINISIFKNKLCYEIDSKEAIEALYVLTDK